MATTIIDDGNFEKAIAERMSRLGNTHRLIPAGCLPRRQPYGCIKRVPKATDFLRPIPREDWPGLITAGKGTFLHDLTKDKLEPHDQGRTNYCWAHGSVRAVEALGVFETGNGIPLSAESVAVPLTGGRNRGGYPEEALQRLRSHGACLQELWPLNDRDERHADAQWEMDAIKRRAIRWADVNTFDMQMTFALMRVPVPIGLRWWGHLVCQLDPVHFGGKDFGIGIDNSWGSDWGDNGYGILTESRGTADLGAFALLTESFAA